MSYHKDELEIDLREILHILKKRILIIILTAMIFAVGSGVYNFFIATPVYDATSRLFILSQSTSITSLADIQVGSSLTLDYMELIKSRPVVDQVIKNAGLKMDYEELSEKVTLTNPAETRILSINVRDESAYEAARIANEFAVVAQKQISEIMKTDEPTIAEQAYVAEHPIKPEKARNILIAFLLGAFLSALVTIVIRLMDDTIEGQEDVERYLLLNTLAVVPVEENEKRQLRRVSKKGGK